MFLIVAQIGGTLDAGPGPLGVTGTMAIMIPWIAAQWEEYHSGLMLYSNGTVGITEVRALPSLGRPGGQVGCLTTSCGRLSSVCSHGSELATLSICACCLTRLRAGSTDQPGNVAGP